jgi:hypothetical protein
LNYFGQKILFKIPVTISRFFFFPPKFGFIWFNYPPPPPDRFSSNCICFTCPFVRFSFNAAASKTPNSCPVRDAGRPYQRFLPKMFYTKILYTGAKAFQKFYDKGELWQLI